MRTVKFMGRELKIGFDMSVEMSYEEISGKPFNVDDFSSAKSSVALYMAAIVANNPDTDITIETLLHDAMAVDIMAVRDAVVAEFTEWCKLPEATRGEEQADAPDGEGEKANP